MPEPASEYFFSPSILELLSTVPHVYACSKATTFSSTDVLPQSTLPVNRAHLLRRSPGISVSYGGLSYYKYLLAKWSVYGRRNCFHLFWMWTVLLKKNYHSNSTKSTIWAFSFNMELIKKKPRSPSPRLALLLFDRKESLSLWMRCTKPVLLLHF